MLAIAADVALVGVSIFAFDTGKNVGKMLSGRDEESKTDDINTSQTGLNYTS